MGHHEKNLLLFGDTNTEVSARYEPGKSIARRSLLVRQKSNAWICLTAAKLSVALGGDPPGVLTRTMPETSSAGGRS